MQAMGGEGGGRRGSRRETHGANRSRTGTSRGRMGYDTLLESLTNDIICASEIIIMKSIKVNHVRHSKMKICQLATYLSISTPGTPKLVPRMLSNSSQQASSPSQISCTGSESTGRPRSARLRASRPVSVAWTFLQTALRRSGTEKRCAARIKVC
jgi:hypothetical protein